MISVVLAAALTLRDIVFINQAAEAVFNVRIGHVADSTWSDDLLGFADVIDVSRGVSLHVPVDPSVCTYDVKATLRSGAVVLIPNVNLCTIDRLPIQKSML
jgi:hypothetical protein